MIARKEWFKPRILGWGLRPVTKEGWLYVTIFILLIFAVINLSIDPVLSTILATIIIAIFLADSFIVMFQMYRSLDKDEKRKQAFMETIASYVGVGTIIIVLIYDALALNRLNIGIIIVLLAMVAAKTASSLYYYKKFQK